MPRIAQGAPVLSTPARSFIPCSHCRNNWDLMSLWYGQAPGTSSGCSVIGWKRIVVTVGEKIGKDHLTYGQGAAAEITAMFTIGLADWFGLPVSTTHVLSSGVAGTIAANRTGLQLSTVRNLAMAWVLTLPASIILSASLFWPSAKSVSSDARVSYGHAWSTAGGRGQLPLSRSPSVVA